VEEATMETVRRRVAGIAMMLLHVVPSGVEAQVTVPPDTVSTVFVSDSIPGYGAVGGVATDALGFVYVADFRNSVWRLSPEGRVATYSDGFYGASGNAVGPKGNLFQSSFNGNYVSRISRTGAAETYATEGLSGPVGIAVDADGVLYVCNCSAGTISRVGTDGVARTFAESEMMACPNGITFDDRGDLYVVSFNNTLVLRVTPDGAVSRFTDVPGAGGNGHIAFGRGGFYVTKFRGNQVYRVARDGSVRVLAGTGEAGTADGPALTATFTRPNGIAVSPGGKELWVNDLVEGAGVGIGPSVVALRRIRMVSLSDVLAAVGPDEGTDGVRTAHAAYHAQRSGEDTTADAITLAFQWMSSGRVAQGVGLHELNAEAFPDSVAARFNLGEAYRYTGQPEKAAAEYRAALSLDPGNAQAQARLELVGGG
jgi:sugar lactone lactonase YvrE